MSRGGGSGNDPAVAPDNAGRRSLLGRIAGILFFGLVVGTAGSLLAIAVVDTIVWLGDQLFALDNMAQGGISWVLLVGPVSGGLVVGLLLRGMSRHRPDGIADIIFAVQAGENRLAWRDGLINTLSAVIGIGSGASVGHYGPLASMGAALGSNAGRWLRFDASLGIGCGVAAAISTAFSAPIAAILFAHEVVLRHYSLRAFAPITIASSTGFFIEFYVFGRRPLFDIAAERSHYAPEFFAFVLIGIVGALVAVVFMRTVLACAALARRSRLSPWVRPVVAGLGVGLMAQWVPDVLGLGKQVMIGVFVGHSPTAMELAVLLVCKILATALCIGFGFAGGVFSPSLFIGVVTGALLGIAAGVVLGDESSGPAFYAVCGMAAVAGPVIGGPLTIIIIVFELTHNYELTTSVMVSVVFSNVVAYRLFGRSLFDRQLALEGCDLSLGRDKLVLQRTSISDHVTTEAVTVRGDDTLDTARRAMIVADRQECYVLDELGRYLGKIRLFDILQREHRFDLERESAKNHADNGHLQFRHDQSVWDAVEEMRGFIGESIPILDQRGYFIGIVYEASLVTAYLATIADIRAEQHAA